MRSFTLKAALFLLAGVLLGAIGREVVANFSTNAVTGNFIAAVEIVGDTHETFKINSFEGFVIEDFTYNGEPFKGIRLSEIIENSRPRWTENQIMLIGDDGLSALLEGDSLTGSFIVFSEINGWEAINLNHPISGNIKRLREIVVISTGAPFESSINIITAEQNLFSLTPGNLYKTHMSIFPRFEGASSLSHEGQEYSVSIYSRRRVFPLEDLLPAAEGTKLMIAGARGEHLYKFDRSGYLELKGNTVSYLPAERGRAIEAVRGIILEPPAASIMDLYHDSLHYLERGERVLAVFIDGFGYHQLAYALREGYAPFLSTLPPGDKVLAVYQPVTNVGMAAMITGKTPEENGVFVRNQRQLKLASIFATASAMGKRAGLIQGDKQILDLEIEPLFNLDLNKNGTSDDEIFATARDQMSKSYDFLMVHFKSVDEAGHSYGDLHRNTLQAIGTVDGYIRQLVERWSGVVIITSDHGMHTTEEGGDHGVFRFEDMVVPYLVTKGGGRN